MTALPDRHPLVTASYKNEPRHVGVEIEFAALTARQGAEIVRDKFGGEIEEESAHRALIRGARFGDFTCELDSQYAHRQANAREDGFFGAVADGLRSLVGDVSSLILPCEIVCPPIEITEVGELDDLVAALRRSGAAGTEDNALFAFGAQLNPEIASQEADYLTAMLKAYLLLSPWLRSVIHVDATRELTSFSAPFPGDYVKRVLDPDYWPSRERFMADYLSFNPTRNRELDLLPLFKWIDADLLARHVADPRVKPRPTFHYRLPNASIRDESWSVSLEWRRWLLVEQAMADRERLDAMCRAYLRWAEGWAPRDWAIECSEWLLVK